MDSLARSMRISKKTLYHHFSGKHRIVEAIFEDYRGSVTRLMEELIRNPDLGFHEKLARMMEGVGYALSGMSPVFLQDIEDHMPGLWKKVAEYMNEAAYLRFNRLIEEGIQKGYIAEGINKSIIVVLYSGAIHGLFDPRLLSQLPEAIRKDLPDDPSKIFGQVLQIISRGILKHRGSHQQEAEALPENGSGS
jgi:AcrR family transcriptional regulator